MTHDWDGVVQDAISRAEDLGTRFKSSLGGSTALRDIAAEFEVDCVRPYLLDSSALSLRRPDGGITILLNHLSDMAEARHGLAHELGHLILEDIRPNRYRHQRRVDPLKDPQGRLVENLCDRIALSLLMPKARFVKVLDLSTPSASNLLEATTIFGVNVDHVSSRYIDLLPSPGAYLHWSVSSQGVLQSVENTVGNAVLGDNFIRAPSAQLPEFAAAIQEGQNSATHILESLPVVMGNGQNRGLQFVGPFAVETVTRRSTEDSVENLTSFFHFLHEFIDFPAYPVTMGIRRGA